MTIALRRAARMQVLAFIAWVERKPNEERWELLNGEPVLMAPQSERHQMIVANLVCRLGDVAQAKGCRALSGLALLSPSIDDYAPIPDIVVRCGPLLRDGYARDAILAAEVLSPSTMRNDRGGKATVYKALPTLNLFLIFHQQEPLIEVWRCEGEDWDHRVVGPGDTVALPDLDGTFAVDDIYAGIPFDPA